MATKPTPAHQGVPVRAGAVLSLFSMIYYNVATQPIKDQIAKVDQMTAQELKILAKQLLQDKIDGIEEILPRVSKPASYDLPESVKALTRNYGLNIPNNIASISFTTANTKPTLSLPKTQTQPIFLG